MTETLVGVNPSSSKDPADPPPAEELAAAKELVRQAGAQGVALTCPGGLLKALTKNIRLRQLVQPAAVWEADVAGSGNSGRCADEPGCCLRPHRSQPRRLRQLLRWAGQFDHRRWAVENAEGLGRHLSSWLLAPGEEVVDVPSTATARVRQLSRVAARTIRSTQRSRPASGRPSKAMTAQQADDVITKTDRMHPSRAQQDAERRTAGEQWHETGLVFTTRLGTAMNAANVRRDFRRALASVPGLIPEEWTPRELRHSFVSLLSDAGVPIEDVSRLVGHSSTSVTELVYRHQIRPVIQSGATIMDRLFGSPADRPAAEAVAADGIKSPRR